jgi:hypothetical protein
MGNHLEGMEGMLFQDHLRVVGGLAGAHRVIVPSTIVEINLNHKL